MIPRLIFYKIKFMGFVESIKTCFSKYFVFSGRSTRSELWYFVLFLVTGGLSVGIIDVLFYPDISLDLSLIHI